MINLSNVNLNTIYTIECNTSTHLLKERLSSLGFIKGSDISMIKKGYDNMNIYLIKGTMIALRKKEADFIWVK